MARPNSAGVVLDDATLTEIKAAVGVLRTKLVPLLETLSAKDRHQLPKLGDRTSEFKTDLDALASLQALERELTLANDGSSASVYEDLAARFPGAAAKKAPADG